MDSKMSIGDSAVQWVSELKYLGIHFKAARTLDVNITPIKHKVYAAFNSLKKSRCKLSVEPVKLQQLKSFCTPLLSFWLGAIDLKKRAVAELFEVCWNDAFRKIFNTLRFESVEGFFVVGKLILVKSMIFLVPSFYGWFAQSLVTVFHSTVVLNGVIMLFQTY
jgi:hypothetical protein